jgi:hypothetical protein
LPSNNKPGPIKASRDIRPVTKNDEPKKPHDRSRRPGDGALSPTLSDLKSVGDDTEGSLTEEEQAKMIND